MQADTHLQSNIPYDHILAPKNLSAKTRGLSAPLNLGPTLESRLSNFILLFIFYLIYG